MTEGQEFLGVKHSSESNLLSGNKQCTNPICKFNGLVLPCQWPNPVCSDGSKSCYHPGTFLLACSSYFLLDI